MRPTVNPLVYTVSLTFGQAPTGKQRLLIWNLIQMYASKNDVVMDSKAVFTGDRLYFSLGMKRRLGTERKDDPWA
jgi:hypothetical protein